MSIGITCVQALLVMSFSVEDCMFYTVQKRAETTEFLASSVHRFTPPVKQLDSARSFNTRNKKNTKKVFPLTLGLG